MTGTRPRCAFSASSPVTRSVRRTVRECAEPSVRRDREGVRTVRECAEPSVRRDREGVRENSEGCQALPEVTYLVTFSCYGAHLHGDPGGTVDRDHNQPGSPTRGDEPALLHFEKKRMIQRPYLLDERRRAIVLTAIQSVCRYRGWKLFAVHVRQNHVHVVVDICCVPDGAAQDFKEYASRSLNKTSLDSPGRVRWARHSSVRLLPNPAARELAIRYVAANQGGQMALFVAEERTPMTVAPFH
jgi:hypothetical protein